MRVILIGGSRVVLSVVRQFTQRKYHVTIINEDLEACHDLVRQTDATVIFGDGTSPARLEEAGARRADVLIALTPEDQDNLIACQIANRKFGIPKTIALVNDPENEDIFRRLGVKITLSATRIIASMIDQETDFDNITALMPLARGRINIKDVRLTRESAAVGQTLQSLQLSTESLIACIIREEEVIVPRGSTQLIAGDHLILISKPENEQRDLERLLTESEKNSA